MRKLTEETQTQLKELRQKGFSIPELSRLFNISKSTVLQYVKSVPVLPEYQARLSSRRNASKIISERRQNLALASIHELLPQAGERDLAVFAAGIYLGAGSKTDLSITNHDPELIKIFAVSLVKIFKVPAGELRMQISLPAGGNRESALQFWELRLGGELWGKISVTIRESSTRKSLNQFGSCRLRVKRGGLILRMFSAINKRVGESYLPQNAQDVSLLDQDRSDYIK